MMNGTNIHKIWAVCPWSALFLLFSTLFASTKTISTHLQKLACVGKPLSRF